LNLRERIEAAVLDAALRLLRAIGPVRASNIGGAVARTIGPRLPVSRVGRINLRLALPDLDAAAHARILRGAWDNLGRTVAELPHLSRLDRTASGPGWEVAGEEHAAAVAAAGGPAIVMVAHLANWEIMPRIGSALGVFGSAAYRAANNRRVDAILTRLRREAAGVDLPLFPKGARGARAAVAHMAKGGTIGLLMDQKLNEGIAVDFFGHPAMTAPALAAFALRFRCPVLPVHVERIGPVRFRLIVDPPLELPATGDRQADILALTRQVNATLERWIRARPQEWLWLHRRWDQSHYRK
jgi:KDO2-lipid IV(A) lauroyltransferase